MSSTRLAKDRLAEIKKNHDELSGYQQSGKPRVDFVKEYGYDSKGRVLKTALDEFKKNLIVEAKEAKVNVDGLSAGCDALEGSLRTNFNKLVAGEQIDLSSDFVTLRDELKSASEDTNKSDAEKMFYKTRLAELESIKTQKLNTEIQQLNKSYENRISIEKSWQYAQQNLLNKDKDELVQFHSQYWKKKDDHEADEKERLEKSTAELVIPSVDPEKITEVVKHFDETKDGIFQRDGSIYSVVIKNGSIRPDFPLPAGGNYKDAYKEVIDAVVARNGGQKVITINYDNPATALSTRTDMQNLLEVLEAADEKGCEVKFSKGVEEHLKKMQKNALSFGMAGTPDRWAETILQKQKEINLPHYRQHFADQLKNDVASASEKVNALKIKELNLEYKHDAPEFAELENEKKEIEGAQAAVKAVLDKVASWEQKNAKTDVLEEGLANEWIQKLHEANATLDAKCREFSEKVDHSHDSDKLSDDQYKSLTAVWNDQLSLTDSIEQQQSDSVIRTPPRPA